MIDKEKEILEQFGFRKGFSFEDRFDLKTEVEYNGKTYGVSTVELGMNHNFGIGRPLNYETMIFIHDGFGGNNEFEYFQKRYTTQEEAKKAHFNIVNLFRNGKADFLIVEKSD